MECECTISSDMAQPGKICRLHFAYMEQAVAAERERCARIAEIIRAPASIGRDHARHHEAGAQAAAAAIRKGARQKVEDMGAPGR
jgi:hypothetical protein